MDISPEACGVIATVIPIYTIVLYVGRDRLLRGPGHWLSVLVLKAAVIAVTAAEVLAVVGLVKQGQTGLWGGLVVMMTVSPVVTVGAVALQEIGQDALRERVDVVDERQRVAARGGESRPAEEKVASS
jgi:hypothetical protein